MKRLGRETERNIWLGLLFFAALILAACSSIGAPDTPSSPQPAADAAVTDNEAVNALPPAPKRGHPAPAFTLATLDGEEVSLSDFRGKPVIVNFWASWCGPCRLEMPDLQETFAEQGDALTILGINLTERDGDLDEVAGFIDEFALTFPIVLDTDGEVADLYRVRGQPASVFIDADGMVATVFYGVINEQFIKEQISELVES